MIVFNIFILIITVSDVLSQEPLASQFPLFGLTDVAGKRSVKVKSVCGKQLKIVNNGIKKRETWALKMLDSSGSPVTGFIWGNNYWLGAYSQCRWMSVKSGSSLKSTFPPFDVSFYISLFKQNTSLQTEPDIVSKGIIHLGLCLPSSCTTEDLEDLLTLWAKQSTLGVQNLYNFTMDFQKVRPVRPDFSWLRFPLTIVLFVIITVAFVLTLVGTFYENYIWKPFMKRREVESKANNNSKSFVFVKSRNIQESSNLLNQDNNLNDCYELKIDNSQHKSMPVHIIKTVAEDEVEEYTQNILTKLFLCFSATSNIKIIFEAPKKKNELSITHGLRFFAMIWLIWLYSIFYLKHFADNKPLAQRLSEAFSEQIISNSTFSVDTFFFISGFSLAFKYYRNRRSSQKTDRNFSVKRKVNEFCFMTLKKFLRLTPVYAVILGVVIVTVRIIRQTSLFEVEEAADEICKKYWWRNIAYINNLYKGEEMCMSWSWYLSTDMQYFLIGVFILILSTRFWKFASFLVGALVLASSFFTGYLSYGNGYIPVLQPQLNLLHVIHYSPWTRISPYLIGMFTGYFVIHLKGELFFKRTVLVTCWLVWFFCNTWALFGLYSKNMSALSTALHTALSRTAWGVGLCWIVIASYTNNAGAIKAVLTYPGWIPFSKLSYSAYLLSPLIINLIASNAETAVHLDFLQLVVYFFGHLGIIYFCSFFVCLVLEIPLISLVRATVRQKPTQNQLNGCS